MTSDLHGQPVEKIQTLPRLRLVLAWIITLAVVLYAWARTLIFTMLAGRPEPLYPLLLLAGLIGVARLTHGLSAAFRPGFTRWVALGVALPWVLASGLLVGLYAGTDMSPFVV